MTTDFELMMIKFLKEKNLINPDKSIKDFSYSDMEEFRKRCLEFDMKKRNKEFEELFDNPKVKKRLRKLKLKQIEDKEIDIDDRILLSIIKANKIINKKFEDEM